MRSGQPARGLRTAVFLLSIALGGCATIDGGQPPASWVASWGTAQLLPDSRYVIPDEQWRDATLRQVVRVSLPGERLRVRFSNVFGTTPLVIAAAGIARSAKIGTPDLDGATHRALTFDGRAGVTIPAGAEYYSDPVALAHTAFTDLAISLHYQEAPKAQTGHPGARTTSFMAKGNRVADATWPAAEKFTRWYHLADVEVQARAPVLVAIGDSITDGNGATTDVNNRWTDFLAQRVAAEGAPMGVVNAGIGGGRLLRDGIGPNVVARFDRDVLARSGVTHAVVLIGVNDLGVLRRNKEDTPEGRAQLVADMKAGYRQVAQRARAHGICIIGATILPYGGSEYYSPGPDNEADRRSLNDWIRTSGTFDAVADFDAATRDPQRPERIAKPFDQDGLHTTPEGFRVMADAVPLAALRKDCRNRP